MYQGFKLAISEIERQALLGDGDLVYNPIKATVGDGDMEKALQTDNANWIMDNWFRDYDADIFLSHSHGDIELASKVAALFNQKGLRVFIDSDVWGCCDNMLREIDNVYSVSERAEDGRIKTYSYDKRNVTTSHVHMLLSHALTRMIARTECFIFLKTSKSAFNSDKREIGTYSPWLFHELEVANVIERQRLLRKGNFSGEKVAMDETVTESYKPFVLKFSAKAAKLREVSLQNLIVLLNETDSAMNWYSHDDAMHFLDQLYEQWTS